jgi:hypothetical protein
VILQVKGSTPFNHPLNYLLIRKFFFFKLNYFVKCFYSYQLHSLLVMHCFFFFFNFVASHIMPLKITMYTNVFINLERAVKVSLFLKKTLLFLSSGIVLKLNQSDQKMLKKSKKNLKFLFFLFFEKLNFYSLANSPFFLIFFFKNLNINSMLVFYSVFSKVSLLKSTLLSLDLVKNSQFLFLKKKKSIKKRLIKKNFSSLNILNSR